METPGQAEPRHHAADAEREVARDESNAVLFARQWAAADDAPGTLPTMPARAAVHGGAVHGAAVHGGAAV